MVRFEGSPISDGTEASAAFLFPDLAKPAAKVCMT
jgi:hypothetical protein